MSWYWSSVFMLRISSLDLLTEIQQTGGEQTKRWNQIDGGSSMTSSSQIEIPEIECQSFIFWILLADNRQADYRPELVALVSGVEKKCQCSVECRSGWQELNTPVGSV